ncbi:MAG TPA: hypothetical protein VJB95_01425 [Candidatus Paceibacterota bacterium]
MSQSQYLRMLEKEIQKINKVIDRKILRGEEYWKEARDHKLMLRRMRYHYRQSYFRNFVRKFFPRLQRFA